MNLPYPSSERALLPWAQSFVREIGARLEQGASKTEALVEADGSTETFTAAGVVSSPRVVISLGDYSVAQVDPADATQAEAICGLAITTGADGEEVQVKWDGTHDYNGWAWEMDLPIFVTLEGNLTQAWPAMLAWTRVAGYPILPTRMRIDFEPPVYL